MGDRGGGQQSAAPGHVQHVWSRLVAAPLATPSEESKMRLFASCTPENCGALGNLETCESDSTGGGATANSSIRLYSQS